MINELKKTHPYEEVSYQIYKLENIFQDVGSGIVGELDNEISTIEFLNKLKSVMKTDCIRYTKIVKDTIKRVSICGGSGSFLLNKSTKLLKSDIFISSDFKYHEFFNMDDDIVIN